MYISHKSGNEYYNLQHISVLKENFDCQKRPGGGQNLNSFLSKIIGTWYMHFSLNYSILNQFFFMSFKIPLKTSIKAIKKHDFKLDKVFLNIVTPNTLEW